MHAFTALVYAAGTQPSDINTGMIQALAGCPAVYLTDANNRLASFAPLCAEGNQANPFQFNTPGRYLIICTFLPHFEGADMWGWVIVK